MAEAILALTAAEKESMNARDQIRLIGLRNQTLKLENEMIAEMIALETKNLELLQKLKERKFKH